MEASEIGRLGSMRRSSSVWRGDDVVFSRSSRDGWEDGDDEEALKWAALEKLPTLDRVHRGILALSVDEDDGGRLQEVEVEKLGFRERRALVERLVRVAEEDNERFLLKLRDRIDRCDCGSSSFCCFLFPEFFSSNGRVGLDFPTIEVRYEHLSVEAKTYVGDRGLPTILNSAINVFEV